MTDEFEDLKKAENQGRISQWEKIGVAAIKADLERSNGLTYVGRHALLAWKWVKYKEMQRTEKQSEELSDAVSLTPEFFGFSVDLKKLFSWGRNKFIR